MSLSKDDYEKEQLRRERWRIEQQKKRDANTSIKKGKKVIDNILLNNKSKSGQQTHGRANKAGTGLNSQDGKKKTKEDRKKENRTEEDERNEKASWLVNFQDKNSIELVKKFSENDDSKAIKKKKLSKKEQIVIENKKRILNKEITDEKKTISKIQKCNTFEEAYYFYRSIKHCQLLYLFELLEWCYNKYTDICEKSKQSVIEELLVKIKTIILHIDDRKEDINMKDITVEQTDILVKCKEFTEHLEDIEMQLNGYILPKPMNDFKDIMIKADLWQKNVINEIINGNNILVCAPTSTGKTVIGTFMTSRKGKTLFIVPNESVAIQVAGVSKYFSDGNYTVQTKKFIIPNDNATMIIGTPIEVENFLIKTKNFHFENIIIDEIHCLNNNNSIEEIEFSNSIKRLMLILSGQFLLLSATLTDESMNNLKNHIEKIKDKECKVIKHTERFINLQFRIMNSELNIESVNPFSQIDLSEMNEFKGKNMSLTNKDIWNFWESCLDEDEFLLQMKKWLGEGLLNLNDIQKVSNKIPKFIESQIKDDPEFIEEVLEEVGSNSQIYELDLTDKEQMKNVILKLIKELKQNDLLPAILFQEDNNDCYDIHSLIVNSLQEEQDKQYPNYYEEKKMKAKEFDKIQSKIDKMKDSSTKIKSSSKQDRDSAYKAQEQKREAQKEQISNMQEMQYGIDLNIHAPHPDFSCGITQISDDSMRRIRWTMNLKTNAYEEDFMKGVQRGIGIYTSDMPSVNQHVMRELIKNKNIGLLVASNSLAYGVNLPIRTVIILYDGTVSSQTILQQIGRAGRRGLDTQGNIIILKIKNNTQKSPIKEILMAKFPTIKPELDSKYFSYTEIIKPFAVFETKKKADKYLEYLLNIKENKDISLVKDSIDEKFINAMYLVLNNEPDIINDYLVKIIWLIENRKVNIPDNAKFLCYIPYNMNKNVSTINLFLLLPFLLKKFKNIKGISYDENRYIFRLLICLYDYNEGNELIDEEIIEELRSIKPKEIFNDEDNFTYCKDIYDYYFHNNLPENKRDIIKIKSRFQLIHDILSSIIRYIDETEFTELKGIFTNVYNRIDKMIEKCQII